MALNVGTSFMFIWSESYKTSWHHYNYAFGLSVVQIVGWSVRCIPSFLLSTKPRYFLSCIVSCPWRMFGNYRSSCCSCSIFKYVPSFRVKIATGPFRLFFVDSVNNVVSVVLCLWIFRVRVNCELYFNVIT